jgi:hypothetical protein
MKGDSELAALVVAVNGDERLEQEVGEAMGRFRHRQDRAIRDMEAARLLPLGWQVVVEIQGGCKSSAYYRAEKGRTQSKKMSAG